VSGKTKIEVSDRDWDSSRGLKLILNGVPEKSHAFSVNCRSAQREVEVTHNPVFKDIGLESLNDHDHQASSTFGTPGYSGFDWQRCD
jgi:hypothetical protein